MSEILSLLVAAGWGVGLLVAGGIIFDLSRRRARETRRPDSRDD